MKVVQLATEGGKAAVASKKTSKKPFRSVIEKNPSIPVLSQHFCVYRKEVNDYVFLPAGYGRKFSRANQGCATPSFCKQCRLQPCMNLEYKQEIYGHGHSLAGELNPDQNGELASEVNEKIVGRLFDCVVQNIVRALFGKEYQEKKGVPRCVWDMVLRTFPSDSEYWYASSDDEEEDDVLSLPKNHYF